LEYKPLEVCIPSRYSEYLLMVKSVRQKRRGKNVTGIEKFGIDQMKLSGIGIDNRHR